MTGALVRLRRADTIVEKSNPPTGLPSPAGGYQPK